MVKIRIVEGRKRRKLLRDSPFFKNGRGVEPKVKVNLDAFREKIFAKSKEFNLRRDQKLLRTQQQPGLGILTKAQIAQTRFRQKILFANR